MCSSGSFMAFQNQGFLHNFVISSAKLKICWESMVVICQFWHFHTGGKNSKLLDIQEFFLPDISWLNTYLPVVYKICCLKSIYTYKSITNRPEWSFTDFYQIRCTFLLKSCLNKYLHNRPQLNMFFLKKLICIYINTCFLDRSQTAPIA